MSRRKHIWKDYISWGLLALSFLILLWATTVSNNPGNTDQAAKRLERTIDRKMVRLDRFVEEALAGDMDAWMELDKLPPDMVVYRYVQDTLQSWDNTFTVANDDISTRMLFQRLANPNNGLSSPLSDVTDEVSFLNLGQRWYLVKSKSSGDCKVIAGLEVMDELDPRSTNRVNPSLHLNDKFSIQPVSTCGGSKVSVQGIPLLTVLLDSFTAPVITDSYLIWVVLIFFVSAMLLFLSDRRTIRMLLLVMSCIVLAMGGMYLWGIRVQNDAYIFSPTLYADGRVLYSLGAVLILNMAVLSIVLSVYLVRNDIYRRLIRHPRRKLLIVLLSLLILAVMSGIFIYTHVVFSSIVLNSNINLEIYKLDELTPFSAVVYLSFLTMMVSIPVLAQMLRPGAKALFNIHFDAFSGRNRILFAFVLGIYFVLVSAILGFQKEQNHIEVWADRLSVDRDINLELQLRMVEGPISNDILVSTLSALPSAGSTIQNRIVDNYMYSISQDYDISVMVMGQDERNPAMLALFNEAMREGTKIHDNSRFLYSTTVSGRPRYVGMFTFFNSRYGLSYVLLDVEPKASRETRGYSSLLDIAAPGKVELPSGYSYAKYSDDALKSSKGNYAYPTIMSEEFSTVSEDRGLLSTSDGFIHYVHNVEDNETLIVSRKKESIFNYVISSVFLALTAFLLFSIPAFSRRRNRVFEKTYYKNRITSVLMLSLLVTLVTMATVSVFFVYNRNDANKKEMMSDRINSLQGLMSESFRYVDDYRQLNSQDLKNMLQNVADMSRADITLYSPQGKAFMSTAREVFDRMLVSDRMNEDAYEDIVFRHRRFCINKESMGSRKFMSLYAPLINSKGDMVAIMCSPYVDEGYDFEMEAVMHTGTIFTVFLILLLLARFISSTLVDRMLQPIVQIGRKMNRTDIDNLEYIDYDREDEISTLVQAYNMMVSDLAESTKQLAQAERDKAWSSMARQVAHEIKNPLTPMKLQMQRLIRMKQRNAPGWEEKFDEVSKVVLDHIDILTDTANEFSTFAKLYTEEPSEIQLDKLLQEEISMFDNRDGIEFVYYGMEGATVMGPKPQLTRVFVNLITNSVQAIDIQQQEAIEDGKEAGQGKVVVSLRHSDEDGYYDIVFEDNGPGVAQENQSRLFTPNFTTKNAGTGLGLAICRSILEKCGARISYSRSFTLDGACFTVHYPKKQA